MARGGAVIIFITKRRGFATPVNDAQIPRFYYIHQPDGSPPMCRMTSAPAPIRSRYAPLTSSAASTTAIESWK